MEILKAIADSFMSEICEGIDTHHIWWFVGEQRDGHCSVMVVAGAADDNEPVFGFYLIFRDGYAEINSYTRADKQAFFGGSKKFKYVDPSFVKNITHFINTYDWTGTAYFISSS